MKKTLLIFVLLFALSEIILPQKAVWSVAGNKITTPWAKMVNPLNPLPEYPQASDGTQ